MECVRGRQFINMTRGYYADVLFMVLILVIISTEANGQPTVDDDGTCGSRSPTSEQVANLIQKLEEVITLNQVQSTSKPAPHPVDASKHALVSALECEYRSHVIGSCLYLLGPFRFII